MTNEPNHKKLFIDALRSFALREGKGTPDGYGRPDYQPSRGEVLLARMIADYLSGPDIYGQELGVTWAVWLPYLLEDAFEEFRAHDKWERDRVEHRRQTEHDIPSLTNIHEGGIFRTLVVHSLVRLMPILAAPTIYGDTRGSDLSEVVWLHKDLDWLHEDLEAYFNAQWGVINQAWRRFVKKAYAPLLKRIKSEKHRGNEGTFGETKLMAWAGMGRVMFTFRRKFGDEDQSITYIADDSDPIGMRSGPNVPDSPYQVCVDMIDEVVAHWDIDKFVRADDVKLAGF